MSTEASTHLQESGAILDNDRILQMQRTYFESLSLLGELFHSNSSHRAIFHGSGFDGIPLSFAQQSYSGGCFSIEHKLRGKHHLYQVHKSSVVLEEGSPQQYKNKYPLLLYKYGAQPGAPWKLKLNLSARTHSLLLSPAHDFGWPLKECIVVRSDDMGVPKFHLSSKLVLDKFNCVAQNLQDQTSSVSEILHNQTELLLPGKEDAKRNSHVYLQYNLPNVAFKVQNGTPSKTHDCEEEFISLWHDVEKDSICSIKSLPMLNSHQWPQEAEEWSSRQRIWPDRDLINLVLRTGAYYSPAPDTTVDTDGDLYWEANFSEAVNLLCKSFSNEQLTVAMKMLSLFDHIPSIYQIVRTIVLWYAEKSNPNQWLNSSSGDPVKGMLAMMFEFLQASFIPHYFIPEKNLLTSIDAVDVQNLANLVDQLLSHLVKGDNIMVESCSDECPTLGSLGSSFADKLEIRYQEVFGKSVNLFGLQLYQWLHNKDDVMDCIDSHLAVLRSIDSVKCEACVAEAIGQFICQSLGTCYFIKSHESYFSREKKLMGEKAEGYLRVAKQLNANNLTGLIRLAMYYYRKDKNERVVEILKPYMTSYIPTEDETQTGDCTNNELTFKQRLWKELHDGSYTFDVFLSNHETPVLPGVVAKNLTFAQNQWLGYTCNPVATFDATLMACFLYALSLGKLGRHDEAITGLRKVEERSLNEQTDLNEKRNIAYLNVLAHCYLEAGELEQGKHLLERSLAMLPNPRNTARWKLMALGTERCKYWIMGSVGVAITTITAIAAVAIHKAIRN